MFKFLKTLFKRKSKEIPYEVFEFGKYENKPVTMRALELVTSMPQESIVGIISHQVIKLNGVNLTCYSLRNRLESGQYTIEMPHLRKKWTFYIA
jgi:hypothetical protein